MKAIINPITRSVQLEKDKEIVDIFFDDLDEWQEVEIGGKVLDIHFDYMPRDNFGSQRDWLHGILRAFDKSSEFEEDLIEHITLEL
jgi:hypothetical protein